MSENDASEDERYFVLTIDVPAAAADLFSGVLFQLGARGIEIIPAEGLMLLPGVEPPAAGLERLRASFAERGAEARAAVERNLARHLEAVPPELREGTAAAPRVEGLKPVDWSKLWRSFFEPLELGERLFLRPSWEEAETPPGRVELVIDPGLAFGTGGHVTTRLCLEWVEAHAGGHSLLDLGTGTGILALAAAKLGATRVLALDNDPGALAVARDNLEFNGEVGSVELDHRPLDRIDESFERAVANVLAEPLIDMARDLASRLLPGGELALSGILVEQLGKVSAAYCEAGLVELHRREEGDWGLLHFRRPAP